ncbi:MAG TPA: hypothetical protein PKM72_02480 [Nitrospirales bacterium]|nr:hypothetical protein [Nitrospira sp. MA-1]HNP59675.1 hypothetical protein [Nitrospirales bacterium]
MTNHEKAKLIAPWINPAERVTVDFKDEIGLNAEVFGCTENVVHLLFQEAFPHIKEQITIPLREVEVGEDHGRYTRDPDTPLQWRLRLQVNRNRPEGM